MNFSILFSVKFIRFSDRRDLYFEKDLSTSTETNGANLVFLLNSGEFVSEVNFNKSGFFCVLLNKDIIIVEFEFLKSYCSIDSSFFPEIPDTDNKGFIKQFMREKTNGIQNSF
jgi:hypothetical protein